MWSMLSASSNYILSLSFSFSNWVVPSLLFIKYVYYHVVHLLQNFVDEVGGDYNLIVLPAILTPKIF